MSKAKTVDLTSGPILKTLAELALPIMVSSMLGTAYSIMDMAWIGLLGAKAVAGVGVGGMYVWLSQGLASLPRMGGQIESVSWNTADGFASALNAFIAQNYGARKKDRIRKGYSLSFRVLAI